MTDDAGPAAAGGTGWTDSHCHLQDRYRDGPDEGAGDAGLREVLERAARAGVTAAVCIGTDADSSREAVRIANLEDLAIDVYATVGLHPHEASTSTRGLAALLDADGADRVVGIGECGLDYYYEHSPRDAQLVALRDQLALAVTRDLAVVLHVRDAFDDLFSVLDDVGVPPRTIVHCFSAGPAEARRCVAAGMMVSVAGIVTFKNADPLRAALAEVPLDRLLVETDAPYLAPVPHRGRRNEPAFVVETAKVLAAVKGISYEALAAATTENFFRLFRKVPRP